MKEHIRIKSFDGEFLDGDITIAPNQRGAILLSHGITADRHESGLYDTLAERLHTIGISTLTFDLRGHGKSGGRQEDLTLSGCINDIASAACCLLSTANSTALAFVSSSFSGALTIAASFKCPIPPNAMVLLNPRLDYLPWVTDSPYWSGSSLTVEGANILQSQGYLIRNGFHIGRPLFNEILCFRPVEGHARLACDILFIHGTKDSVVPFTCSQLHYNDNRRGTLFAVDGADHGFTLPDDENPMHPQNQAYAETVISKTVDWFDEHF